MWRGRAWVRKTVFHSEAPVTAHRPPFIQRLGRDGERTDRGRREDGERTDRGRTEDGERTERGRREDGERTGGREVAVEPPALTGAFHLIKCQYNDQK